MSAQEITETEESKSKRRAGLKKADLDENFETELTFDRARSMEYGIEWNSGTTQQDLRTIYKLNGWSVTAYLAYYSGIVEGRKFAELWTAPNPSRVDLIALKARAQAEIEAQAKVRAHTLFAEMMENLGYDEMRKVADKLTLRKGRFTKQEYQTILACLHPDNSASKEKREEAFRLFSEAAPYLMDQTQHPIRGANLKMPLTREDLMARRAEMQRKKAGAK